MENEQTATRLLRFTSRSERIFFDNGPYSSSSLNACCFESKNHCLTADLVAQVSTLIALWYPEDVRLLLPSLLPEFPLPFPEPEQIAPITRMLSRFPLSSYFCDNYQERKVD